MSRPTTLLLISLILSFAAEAASIADVPTPKGYSRVDYETNSFGAYLRALPISGQRTIKMWDGTDLPEELYDVLAVVDVPLLFNQDLEQCADFAMRFWADFHKDNGRLNTLELFDYRGRPRAFSEADKSYRSYLRWHMAYSNSHSLKEGTKKIDLLEHLRIGDMFVQNDTGGIGHVSMIVDEARSKTGLPVYLVGYSYMPAQQFHIERAAAEYGVAGWYTADGYQRYAEAAFSSMGRVTLRRF